MDQPHHHRAFAHRGGDPLDRTVPNVADRKDAGKTGLQQQRSPIAHGGHLRPGDDEAILGDLQTLVEPVGVRLGADEGEQAARHQLGLLAVRGLEHHGLQDRGADQGLDLRPVVDRDPRIAFDLVDQVARHGCVQRRASDQVMHGLTLAEEDGRLSR